MVVEEVSLVAHRKGVDCRLDLGVGGGSELP